VSARRCFKKRVPCFAKVVIVWFQKICKPPPQRVIGNSEGEGVLKAKIFEGTYAPKLEFPEGWGVQTKKTKSQKLSET